MRESKYLANIFVTQLCVSLNSEFISHNTKKKSQICEISTFNYKKKSQLNSVAKKKRASILLGSFKRSIQIIHVFFAS